MYNLTKVSHLIIIIFLTKITYCEIFSAINFERPGLQFNEILTTSMHIVPAKKV